MKRLVLILALVGILIVPASAAARTPWQYRPHAKTPHRLPPHWKQWIAIGKCEQPGTGWKGVAWTHDGPGVSFPGGLGYTILLGEWYKPADATGRMSTWTPLQQLWAAERGYYHYEHLLGPQAATTLWDCSAVIGWTGFAYGDES